jgi:phosphoglycolate phosphatase
VPLLEHFTTLLFDLDGTLTDPKIGITKSVQYSLEKMGILGGSLDSLVKFIGPPLKESYVKYYALCDEDADLAIKYYREYFSVTGIFENALYTGIDVLLKELWERNTVLVVATSKPTVYSKRICEHFDIMKYFTAIEGSELDGTRSSKAELIGYIIKKYGIDKERTLMIGDREHDIIGAKRNSIKSVGVGYGYGGREELENAGADYYVRTIEELSELLIGKEDI